MADESGPENSPDDKGYFTTVTDVDSGKKSPARILTPEEAKKEHHARDGGRRPDQKRIDISQPRTPSKN